MRNLNECMQDPLPDNRFRGKEMHLVLISPSSLFGVLPSQCFVYGIMLGMIFFFVLLVPGPSLIEFN